MAAGKSRQQRTRTTDSDTRDPAKNKRGYRSPLRQQQAAETRRRIIAAGAELVHSFPTWDWKNLTAAAVSERAGVSERTVHRHFANERQLRDEVLQRLVEESGVNLEELTVEDFAGVTARIFDYQSSFAAKPSVVDDPTFAEMDRARRDALQRAVLQVRPDWSTAQRETAAAALDILWNQAPYERLISAWGFDSPRAVSTLSWLINLIEDAIRSGRSPG